MLFCNFCDNLSEPLQARCQIVKHFFSSLLELCANKLERFALENNNLLVVTEEEGEALGRVLALGINHKR